MMRKFSKRDTLKIFCALPALMSTNVLAGKGAYLKSNQQIANHFLDYCKGLDNHVEVIRLGVEYRRAHIGESDIQSLMGAIERDSCIECGRTYLSRSQFNKMTSNAIKLDFEIRNIAITDGWWLSRTEARIYALASLLV